MGLLRRSRKGSGRAGSDGPGGSEVIGVDPPASTKKGRKAQKEQARADKKAGKKAEKDGPELLTGAKVKRYIGIARIVVPVVAPLVYQAVGTARAQWDQRRARQLGVAPEELGEFTGHGAALYARIHSAAMSARDLRTRRGDGSGDGDAARTAEIRAFADDAEGRLADLEAAVRAAEQMPAARRRSAHAAAASELERIESRLLALWGVGGPRPGAVSG